MCTKVSRHFLFKTYLFATVILCDEVVISVLFFDSQEVQAISSHKRKAVVRGTSRYKGTVI